MSVDNEPVAPVVPVLVDQEGLVNGLVTPDRPVVSHEHYTLSSDDLFEDDETLEDTVLEEALQECVRDIKAWRAGDAKMRVTVIEDGIRSVYSETAAESEARERTQRLEQTDTAA